jgi:ferredoxin
MRWREFQVVPSRESAIECLRVYYTLGETVIRLADHVRRLGFAARVEHPIGDSDLLHVPIGLKAGFGELGRHGSIIHPRLGPLFRMGSVITSMPLATDRPIDAGIAAFCDTCRACRLYCPPGAIPLPEPRGGQDHVGRTATSWTQAGAFPTSPSAYCSILPARLRLQPQEWARDFEGFQTVLFPRVVMEPAPPFVDVPEDHRHAYPKLDPTAAAADKGDD